ncbi:hypothetical protein FA95DRAFT_1610648 [Auriscalpium vulgare]|uniref:Uncharacterized protein n=1 Tax=Auriscalpium vulgare TaxID=40419 RepID=A0ACB8RE08_9AGAM|nr:hypothetical protein FA95DRAFT_1610648 [Auriscalpium vulgare]
MPSARELRLRRRNTSKGRAENPASTAPHTTGDVPPYPAPPRSLWSQPIPEEDESSLLAPTLPLHLATDGLSLYGPTSAFHLARVGNPAASEPAPPRRSSGGVRGGGRGRGRGRGQHVESGYRNTYRKYGGMAPRLQLPLPAATKRGRHPKIPPQPSGPVKKDDKDSGGAGKKLKGIFSGLKRRLFASSQAGRSKQHPAASSSETVIEALDSMPVLPSHAPARAVSMEVSSADESDVAGSMPAAMVSRTTFMSASEVSFKSVNTLSSRKSKMNMSRVPPGTAFLR